MLVAIPEELLVRILSALDAASLTRCAMACKHIQKAFRSSSLLQYIVELHFNGVIDTGAPLVGESNYPELIDKVQRRRHALMSPKWALNTVTDISLPDYSSSLAYDYVGDTFFRYNEESLEITALSTDFATNVVKAHTVKMPLEQISFGGELKFAIDPAQDLFAHVRDDELTEDRLIKIMILALSTGDAHPLAQKSPLIFSFLPKTGNNNIYGVRLQIARDILMIQYNTESSRMYGNEVKQMRVLIWDWKTSALLLDSVSSSPSIIPSPNSDVGLLDSSYFFVTSTSDSGYIRLYKLVRSEYQNMPPLHLASLHFPPVRSGVIVDTIYNQAGPVEIHPFLSKKSFAVNDDDRVHVFTTKYMYQDRYEEMAAVPTNMYVHQRVFMKYCREEAHRGGPPRTLPWYLWGPANTRILFPSGSQASWERHVHGQRAICIGPKSYDGSFYGGMHSDDAPSLAILDFSLGTVLSAKGILPVSPQPSNGLEFRSVGILVPPTKIRRSQIRLYDQDVETRLPCVSFDVRIQQPYESLIIHENGVIGVTEDEDTDDFVLHMYVI